MKIVNSYINYISPSGTIKETMAEVIIVIPIKERDDAKNFLTDVKEFARQRPK